MRMDEDARRRANAERQRGYRERQKQDSVKYAAALER